ncbi:SusC/RagA family TonB-linked outer membrane protein [Patiriisocius sp. Uisw_047]|uniref:SusC/RagA family TonB-linked outer membrane protein n=1 Tax=Patiriisocius sp. Uisw_047 TaxID=3230969 RepID=UPI0039ED0516
MKYTTFFIMLLLFSSSLLAQNKVVTGTVYEASSGLPLAGATVSEKGTNNGAITGFDGNFSLKNVTPKGVIVVSYIGFLSQEVATVNTLGALNVQLVEDASQLDEVIVVGYGTQRKKEITGAVSVIGTETIEALKPRRIEEALQGQVAGVNITSGSGAPGSGLNIAIRGVSTNGDNRPLILLDGNVIEDLSVVNPADIESINILKDATAGIYGVRAANGVILIVTKSGSYNSELKAEFKSYYGVQETTRKIPVLNATEYALLVNESRTNGGQVPLFNNVGSLGQGTDWQDTVFESAPVISADLTVSGGGENSKTSFGLSYLTQDGIVGGSKANFSRFTARVSHDRKIIEKLKLNTTILLSNTDRKSLSENAVGSVLYNALNNAPIFSVRDASGAFSLSEGLGNEVINPIAQIANTNNNTDVHKIGGSLGLTYEINDNFSVSSRFQGNYAEVDGYSFAKKQFYGSGKVFNIARNSVFEELNIFRDYTFDAFLTYKNTFADKHNVNVVLANSVFRTTGSFRSFTGFDIPGDNGNNASIANAGEVIDNNVNGGNTFDARLLSYFTRIQYDYEGKYLFSGVIRRDGSTKFGPDNKFGYFPSASAGWVLSEEEFLSSSQNLSFLKLRGSYGIIGNDRIGDFGFESLVNGEGAYVIGNELVIGTAVGKLSNPEVKWEEQKTLDIGLDAKFFGNKLDVTVDYFNRRTEDLLLTPQVSGILGGAAPGSGAPTVNAGTVENKGIELSVSYRKTVSENFKYSISANATTLKNEVLFVSDENGFIAGGSFGIGQEAPSRMEAGFPIGYFRGYETDGIFQNQGEVDSAATLDGAQAGDIRFVDINGDGIIDDLDKTDLGNPIPEATFGMNIGFTFKNFDFLTYAYASLGNEIVRNYERFQPLTNRTTAYLGRWTGSGTSADFPRVTTAASNNTLFSDFFVEDGSFIRVQNIQLGYTFSEKLTNAWKMDEFRLYASVSNAFTFTKYRGYDPTTSSGAPIGGGIDIGFYPTPKTYLLGLNLKF